MKKKEKLVRSRRKEKEILELVKEAYMEYYNTSRYPSKGMILRNADLKFFKWVSETYNIPIEDIIRAVRRRRNRLSSKEAKDGYRWVWRRILEERTGRVQIIERTRLGESLWREISRQTTYRVTNMLIKIARENNVDVISIRYMKGVKEWLMRRLNKAMQSTEDIGEKRRLRAVKRILSKFPYRRLIEDIKSEGEWNGIRVVEVPSKDAYITCPVCGYTDKGNRVGRDKFVCMKCGFSDHVDYVASWNLAKRVLEKEIPVRRR